MNLPIDIRTYILSFLVFKCENCPENLNYLKVLRCNLCKKNFCKKHINELICDECANDKWLDILQLFSLLIGS